MKYYNKEYNFIQSTPAPGLLEFPDELMSEFYKQDKRAAGFVNIVDDGKRVTSCVWDEEEYQEWCKENPEPDYLEENKKNKIEDSKKQLETYLLNNPIQWTDGLYYSITQKKQNQLTSKILSATLAKTMSQPYNLTWNSTGEICKTWELEELSALAFAIDERVTKLVTYQQTQEVAIRNCNSQKELDAIIIDYDSVK